MPRLQVIQPGQTANALPSITQGAQPLDVSGVARGAAAIGSSFQEMRDSQDRAIQNLQQDEARLHIVNTTSKAQSDWLERIQKVQDGDPRQSAGMTERMLKEWGTYTDEAEKAAPQMAKEKLRESFAGMRTLVHAKLFNTEIQQRNTVVAEDFETGLDADRRIAMTQPQRALDLVAQRMALAKSLNLPATAREKLIELSRESIAGDAGESLAKADPVAYLARSRMPDKDPLLSIMKPETLKRTIAVAEMRKAQIEGQLAQASEKAGRDAEKREKDAENAMQEVRDFNITGAMPDEGFIASSMDRVKGTAFEPVVQAMLKNSMQGAAFGAKSLPMQAQALAAMDGKATNPETQKLVQRARSINELQQREFKENPWAAGARFHRLPPVPEVQITDGAQGAQLVTERLPMMAALETSTGGAVSPLQPTEAARWGESLKAMPVPQRSEAIASVGSQLSIGRINALAEQMDGKDKPFSLALKLGADRTTAGRTTGQLVIAGAQAIADKRVKKDDAALSGWRAELSTMIRGSLGSEKAENDAIEAAYYVRAAQDAEGGGSNDLAASLVLGSKVLDRGGVKFVPPRGMDEATFDTKARELVRGMDGQQLFYRGKPMTATVLANRLTQSGMRRDKQGRYSPVINGAFITLDAQGTQPLALEIK